MLKAAKLVEMKAGEGDGLEEGTFTAYASVFDNKDSYGDVVRKGAFADSLKEWADSGNTVPVLYGHDVSDPFSNIGSALELKEDEHGLYVKGSLDLDNPKAAQVYRLLKGRRLSQLSFAYDVLEGAFVTSQQSKAAGDEDLGDYYELRKLKLYEVSLVPIGANQETEVLAVKHAANVLTSAKNLSDEDQKALSEAIEKLAALFPEEKAADDKTEASGTGPSIDSEPAVTSPSVQEKSASPNPSVDDLSYFADVAIL